MIDRGDYQVVIGSGFEPGEVVVGEQATGSVSLGSEVADADGTVTFRWLVPAGSTSGENRVVLVGSESGSIDGTFTITAAGSLAQTGAETGGLIPLAALLLGLGTSAVAFSSRHRLRGGMAA